MGPRFAPGELGREGECLMERGFESGLPDADAATLPRDVREELASLGEGLADGVGRLLAAAREALVDDPEAATGFALRARRLAPRSVAAREALGVAAYRSGDFATAKRELQAARRMSGRDGLLPLLADCERALGAPARAIEMGTSEAARRLRGQDALEMLIVASGARLDLGQPEAAVAILARAAARLGDDDEMACRVRYAYAAALEASGRLTDAADWFRRAERADKYEATDAAERADACDPPTGAGPDGASSPS